MQKIETCESFWNCFYIKLREKIALFLSRLAPICSQNPKGVIKVKISEWQVFLRRTAVLLGKILIYVGSRVLNVWSLWLIFCDSQFSERESIFSNKMSMVLKKSPACRGGKKKVHGFDRDFSHKMLTVSLAKKLAQITPTTLFFQSKSA